MLVSALLLLPTAAPLAGGQDSLEELLSRARAEREASQAELAGTVQAALAELETLPPRNRLREAARRRSRLLDLGDEVAPMLVLYLDPGSDPEAGVVFRTRQVVQVLRSMASPAITDALLRQTTTGSVEGRLNALAVLETCPDRSRIAPVVRELYNFSTGRMRTGAMLTLARLGGPEAEAILSAALDDEDPAVIDLALHALGEVASLTVTAKVLELASSDAGASHVEGIGAFYVSQPALFEDQDMVIALMTLLARSDAPRDDTVNVLEAMLPLELDIRSKIRKAMDPLVDHPNQEVREATLVLLARAGDKGARRDLLRPYNAKVSARRDSDNAYTERGDAWYQIGEYSEAIKDYKQAVKLMRARTKEEEPFLGLARCYAQMRKYKDAKVQLDLAPVSIARLQELSRDPAFTEMLESKYRSAFHLPDQDK